MLKNLDIQAVAGGINLIDLGAAGKLSAYWRSLERFLNIYAFEPNQAECERLTAMPHNFATATYIPAAIAGQTGEYTLYQTKFAECWSLLEPDMEWLSRFHYYDLFTVEATSSIKAVSLNDVAQLQDIPIDVIKSDTQGLELPILQSIPEKVKGAFLIETETGFVENYKGETTFHEISAFMAAHHFLLFDLNSNHRIARNNHFVKKTHNQEMLWCEAIWLKDYIAIERQEGLQIDRAKALKALLLCANHGCIDYGFELATLFLPKQLITIEEYEMLKDERSWVLSEEHEVPPIWLKKSYTQKGLLYRLLGAIFNFLPGQWSREAGKILLEVAYQPHPLNKVFHALKHPKNT